MLLPDGRTLSVRSLERSLAHPVGSMHGFLLAGEVGPGAALLSLPLRGSDPVGLYVPVEKVPTWARSAVEMTSGLVSYWAPHLPGLHAAMGELAYKVCHVPGRTDPLVILWRGRELVVFLHVSEILRSQIHVSALRRSNAPEQGVTRVSGTVVGMFAAPAEQASNLYGEFTRR